MLYKVKCASNIVQSTLSFYNYNTILNTNFNTKSSITPGIPNIPTIAADNHVIAIPSPNILSTHKITAPTSALIKNPTITFVLLCNSLKNNTITKSAIKKLTIEISSIFYPSPFHKDYII